VIDWPEQTKYLDTEEKELLRRRMALEISDLCRMDAPNQPSAKLALSDYKIWLSGILYIGVSVAGLSGTFFLPTILNEFGWKAQEAQVRTIPIYVFAAGTMTIGAWASDKLKHRFGFILAGALMTTVGYAMLLDQKGKSCDYKFGAIFPVFGGAYMITPMCLGWLQNNLSGRWKRAFGASIQVMVGNIAGIIGANIFLVSESPAPPPPDQEPYTGLPYITGYSVSLAFMWIGALSALAMFVLMQRENKKRAAGECDHVLDLPEEERNNLGDHHPSFRFVL
jgi:hypothetical protein